MCVFMLSSLLKTSSHPPHLKPFCSSSRVSINSFRGETGREGKDGGARIFSGVVNTLCAFPLWIFKPFSFLNVFSHWSHGKESTWLDSRSGSLSSTLDCGFDFFSKNSSLRLVFLFRVEGLAFFFVPPGASLLRESRVKEKVEPILREKLNQKLCVWRKKDKYQVWLRGRRDGQ